MKTKVWITTQFSALHSWPGAKSYPGKEYLATPHRHQFQVKLWVPVKHDDRDVEFIHLKEQVTDYINGSLVVNGSIGNMSCEQVAKVLCRRFNALACEVSEDGENGALVQRSEVELKRTKMFIGIEAEGPHRGKLVLFVPGSTSPERFTAVMASGRVPDIIERIYYGAGNDYELQHKTLQVIYDVAEQRDWMVDIEWNTDMVPPSWINYEHEELKELIKVNRDRTTVIGFRGCGRDKFFTYIKTIHDDRVVWVENDYKTEHPAEYVTLLADPIFHSDEEIE